MEGDLQDPQAEGSAGCALAGVIGILGSILLGGYFGGWFDSKKEYNSLKCDYISTRPDERVRRDGLVLKIPVTQPDERGDR